MPSHELLHLFCAAWFVQDAWPMVKSSLDEHGILSDLKMVCLMHCLISRPDCWASFDASHMFPSG